MKMLPVTHSLGEAEAVGMIFEMEAAINAVLAVNALIALEFLEKHQTVAPVAVAAPSAGINA